MNGWRGSLTIEAALVVPLVLALFAFAMKSGIQMYTECRGHRAGDRAGAGNRGGKDVLPLAGSGGIISK